MASAQMSMTSITHYLYVMEVIDIWAAAIFRVKSMVTYQIVTYS